MWRDVTEPCKVFFASTIALERYQWWGFFGVDFDSDCNSFEGRACWAARFKGIIQCCLLKVDNLEISPLPWYWEAIRFSGADTSIRFGSSTRALYSTRILLGANGSHGSDILLTRSCWKSHSGIISTGNPCRIEQVSLLYLRRGLLLRDDGFARQHFFSFNSTMKLFLVLPSDWYP